MASIDRIVTNLAVVRERLDRASDAAAAAAELTREVQDQLVAIGAQSVAERFTTVLELIDEASSR